jgi:hypothetical protein
MPAAKKTPGRHVKLADLLREVEDDRHAIVIETDDGQSFRVPTPEMWDDDVFASGGSPLDEAKAIMGEEEYARFREAGGRATLITHLIKEHMQGMSAGESGAS